MHYSSRIEVSSKGFSDVIDITAEVASILEKSGLSDGIISIFVPGSTASVTTIEYEEGVIDDLKNAIERIVPSTIAYKHDRRWGDGNGFSHVRAAFWKPGLTVPFMDKKPALGTWQQIVFIDFDNRPRKRRLVVQVIGD